MRYQLFLLVSFLLFCGGLYAVINHQTVGQLCRDSGRTVRNFGGGMDDTADLVLPLRSFVQGSGKMIVDTCSPT